MRRIVLAVLLLTFLPGPASASGYDYEWALPEWRATYAAPRLADNRGFAVEATNDAVYVAGVAGSQGLGAGDLFLLRYDLAGNLVWSRTWGEFELDQALDIDVLGSSIWVGGSHENDAGETRAVLLRFDTDGELVTQREFQFGVATVIQSVVALPANVAFAGFTHLSRENRDAFVAYATSSGDPIWTRITDGGGWDEVWDLAWDGSTRLYTAGYVGEADAPSQALIGCLHTNEAPCGERIFGGEANDEARAVAVSDGSLYITGGAQSGRSTDVFVARLGMDLTLQWLKTTGGQVVGGGGYGIAVGSRGIYVAGGTYDFPAGGDAALMRFSRSGDLEWVHVAGLPGFWDWNFDVSVSDGKLYTAGVLWQPGLEWYRVTTTAYREDFPTATLTRVARWKQEGNDQAADRALEHFSPGDFLRWAESRGAAPGRSYAEWEGASDSGRAYGRAWIDTASDPVAGEENFTGAIGSLQRDVETGNYALVRDYTGIRVSLFDGLIRLRYYISHDRLIPQGGYIYVGELGMGIPPPPV